MRYRIHVFLGTVFKGSVAKAAVWYVNMFSNIALWYVNMYHVWYA